MSARLHLPPVAQPHRRVGSHRSIRPPGPQDPDITLGPAPILRPYNLSRANDLSKHISIQPLMIYQLRKGALEIM